MEKFQNSLLSRYMLASNFFDRLIFIIVTNYNREKLQSSHYTGSLKFDLFVFTNIPSQRKERGTVKNMNAACNG